jgi:hypothetical protein
VRKLSLAACMHSESASLSKLVLIYKTSRLYYMGHYFASMTWKEEKRIHNASAPATIAK